ncbi:hypothetical protein HK105_202062 [Polyrhizophydium stewartii]|uniref:C2H2-type domain-containing protein n=1 Tax=Polyrhizophydium stewartii TaxID=2732419 RepID=A0ABR4NF71_9FUNG
MSPLIPPPPTSPTSPFHPQPFPSQATFAAHQRYIDQSAHPQSHQQLAQLADARAYPDRVGRASPHFQFQQQFQQQLQLQLEQQQLEQQQQHQQHHQQQFDHHHNGDQRFDMHIHPQPAVHPAHYTGFDHPYVSQEHLHFADHHAQQHYADHAQHDQYAAHYAAAYASPFAGDYAPAPHIRTASATDTASSHATSLATSRSTSPRLLHPQPQALVHTLPHADLAAAQRQAPPAKRMTPPRATTASAGRATKKQRSARPSAAAPLSASSDDSAGPSPNTRLAANRPLSDTAEDPEAADAADAADATAASAAAATAAGAEVRSPDDDGMTALVPRLPHGASGRPFVPPSDFDDSRDLPTCNICGQSFTRLFNLNSHLQSHENVKPFVCDYCGMSFTRRHDLNRHDALKRHYRMHNGKDDKPRPAES